MKKHLIILAFLPLFGFGQIKIGTFNGGIWSFQGGATYYTVYNPFAKSLFSRMDVEPTNVRKTLISNMIDSLQKYSIWDSLDVFYMFASHDSQSSLLNWKYNDFNATANNGVLFAVDTGYKGDGLNDYINSNYNASTDAINYKLNSMSVGFYNRTNDLVDANSYYGARDASINASELTLRTAGKYNIRANSLIVQEADHNNYTSGLIVVRRIDSDTVGIYQNGILIRETANVNSTLIPDLDIYILALNNNGLEKQSTFNQFSMFFAGATLSVLQISKLFGLIESYLDELGIGVIGLAGGTVDFNEEIDFNINISFGT